MESVAQSMSTIALITGVSSSGECWRRGSGLPTHTLALSSAPMSSSGPLVIAAVLAAAVLHAGWNAMVKGVSDRLGLVARMGLVDIVVAAALLWWVAPPAEAAWRWLAASVLLHGAYNGRLLAAY